MTSFPRPTKRVSFINAHPVAYAQTRVWLDAMLPNHGHLPSTSNVSAAASLLESPAADGIGQHAESALLILVMGLPAFLLFRDGKEVGRLADPSLSPQGLNTWLDEQRKEVS